MTFFRRIVALLLLPCLCFEPAQARAGSVPSPTVRDFQLIFGPQAVNAPLEFTGQHRPWQAIQLVRRRFFATTAVVLALLAVKASPAQTPVEGIYQFHPLPISAPLPNTTHLPETVQRKLDFIAQRTQKFQDEMYIFRGTELHINANSRQEYELRRTAYYNEMATFIATDMLQHGEMSAKTAQEILRYNSDPSLQLQAIDFVFNDVMAQFFSRYGLFFQVSTSYFLGWDVPDVEVRPILQTAQNSETIKVFGDRSIPYRLYTVGKNKIRELNEVHPINLSARSGLQTRWGTNQVFQFPLIEEGIAHEVGIAMRLLNQFPKIRDGAVLTAADEPIPFVRARYNFMIRGLQLALGKTLKVAAEPMLRSVFTDSWNDMGDRHEVIHVEDGQHAKALKFSPRHERYRPWMEIRGNLGSSVGLKQIHLAVARLWESAEREEPLNLTKEAHGYDSIFLRNRLGYAYWEAYSPTQHALQLPAGSPVPHQFNDLPLTIQIDILDHVPLLSTQQLWDLHQTLWTEEDSAENAFSRGYDLEIASALMMKEDVGKKEAPSIISSWKWPAASTVAALMALTYWLLSKRRKHPAIKPERQKTTRRNKNRRGFVLSEFLMPWAVHVLPRQRDPSPIQSRTLILRIQA